MDVKEYIESGILELYIAGQLSDKENQEVYDTMVLHTDILNEVKSIENTIVTLSAALTTKDAAIYFNLIKRKLNLEDTTTSTAKVIPISKPTNTWFTYTGWAAAIIVGGFLFWTNTQNNTLKEQVAQEADEKKQLELRITETNTDLENAEKLINVFRDKDVVSVPLAGQAASPNAYAKIYINKKSNNLYLDALGLPKPPAGKVYQVWSLTLAPLTPTSMGTLDSFIADADKIFEFKIREGEQAFGITLEPAGGSETPTMEQLYTLGVIPA